MEGRCASELLWLSEPERSGSLCLCEDGGGGRRGTGVAALGSGCVSMPMGGLRSVSSSRSKESSCTTTSSIFAWEHRRASSHTELAPEASEDGGTGESLPSLSSSSLLFISSSSIPSASPSSSSSSSLSSESPKPSCARARATFLRCWRT